MYGIIEQTFFIRGGDILQTILKMFTDFSDYFRAAVSDFGLNDIFDIIIVAVLIYFIIKFAIERRAGRLALGIVLLLALRFLGELFSLVALQYILQLIFQVGIIAIVIVFQPELRSALEKMGGESLKGIKNITEQKNAESVSAVINDLCEAVLDLSKEKTGALVVIERGTKLGDIIKSGVVLNAEMSPFLLKNIFFNKAPLHDGALIIRDNRLHAAGCLLPLSTNSDIIKDLGTRHRAAIGMSENSDAVVVVVSEETGIVSIAIDGVLKRNFTRISMKRKLEEQLVKESSHRDASHRGFIVKS
jgi:diadenylate cyclase